MDNGYTKWLEKEKAWIDEAERKIKKKNLISLPIVVVAFVVVLGAIGILSGGGVDRMLQNALIGLVAGIVCAPLFYLLMMSSYPAKRFMKAMKAEIENTLSPAELESFAEQMNDTASLQNISWIDKDKTEERVRISKDYALKTSSAGGAVLVQLQKVEQVEIDAEEFTVTTRSGGFRVSQTTVVYPMQFYYKKVNPGKKRTYDKAFSFESRERRDQILACIQKISDSEGR